MTKIGDLLKQLNIKVSKLEKRGKATIIDTGEAKYVVKKGQINNEIYNYLRSRNFDYFPNIIDNIEDMEISEYQNSISSPEEQKIFDMFDLVALLHNKTTYHKEVDSDEYQGIYEDLTNNIEYLDIYYNELATKIESKIFMSPSEYLFIKNVSLIFLSLEKSKMYLEKWKSLIKDKKKQRQVVLHNNLDLSHFVKNESTYLLSWDKSKFGMPLFEIYKFYRKSPDYDFFEILNRYEKNYKLLIDEKYLLFTLLVMPKILEFNTFNTYELKNTMNVKTFLNSLSRVLDLPDNLENTPRR